MEDVCNFSKDQHYDPGKPCRFCQHPTSKLWVPAVGDRGAASNIRVYKSLYILQRESIIPCAYFLSHQK